jgi:hypothetical protein
MSKTTTNTTRQIRDTDYTPEKWLEGSCDEAEINPIAIGFALESDYLRFTTRCWEISSHFVTPFDRLEN